MECFIGAQPELPCCYRGVCGYCKQWGRGASDGHCEHRGQLMNWTSGSNWQEATAKGAFVLPFDLFKLANISDLRSLRFQTTMHLGPHAITPGMSISRGTMMLRWSYMRDVVFPQAGCKLTLVTILRHPVRQLLSAYQYIRPKGVALRAWARRHAATLLGVRAGGFYDAVGGEGNAKSRFGPSFDQYVAALAERSPGTTLDPLLSLIDVVGHVERFDASLLLLVDAAGLQRPLACAAPRNSQEGCEDDARRRKRPATLCYNTTEGSGHWREVADEMPALVKWYEMRLVAFDAAVARKGAQFASRVARLAALRERAAAKQSRTKERMDGRIR